MAGWAGVALLLMGGLGLFAVGAHAQRLPISLLAVVLGVVLGRVSRNGALAIGAHFATRWFLRVGIVLIGFRLSIQQVQESGLGTLSLIVPSVVVGLVVAFLLARAGGLNPRLSLLLSAGTAICGNSAILAAAPVLGADEEDVVRSVSAVTVYGTLALLLFPALGVLLRMDQDTFGRWAGSAINDTSQVIGAGYAFGDLAGETATIVKLTRNLFILPLVVGLAVLGTRWREVRQPGPRLARVRHAFPGFVVAFVLLVLLNSSITIPEMVRELGGQASTVLITSALIGIGVAASRVSIGRSGVVPLIIEILAGIVLALVTFGLLSLGLG